MILTINQKWYITLVIAILFNTGWNFVNSNINTQQSFRLNELEKENLRLKQTNTELLAATFSGQKMLDELPFALWRKKKVGKHYIMKFMNEAGKDQFLKDRGVNRYYYHNKTDFQVFNYDDARKFYIEDSIVAHAKSDTIAHFDTDFYDAIGKKLIKDGYTRWRKIIDGDTMIFGQMDKFYKKQP